ncbi:MAG TPA: polyprenol monophosphomannose synthase [Chthoniobacterales bacterium]|nr:polyprenol monophosphomannose synthase [Chthoniobacterales bacterium]
MNSGRTLIAIPTYNERENVGPLVADLFRIVPEADVLLIDDNSSDGTIAVAQQMFGSDPRFSAVTRLGPRSFGQSLLDAYQIAVKRGYARLVQMDADFSHDPQAVPKLIAASENADLVIGSRYCPGGKTANWPRRRRLLSWFANGYVSLITGVGVADSTAGFRCWRRNALEDLMKVGLNSEGYAFQVETVFQIQRAGLRIVEVPITFTDRRAGQSKMSGKVIFESVLKPWALRFGR